ncbi:MlaD family protein [Chromobacterium vaccinii]|uniref:MlaD family protein n=1 Tax=Chromobacterium vaccinii TaxID=1108595 RepID=UPI003C72453D
MNQDPGESEAPLEDSLPLAVEAPTRRWSPSLIWLLPILAAVVGLGLAAQAILSRGPEVTIAFRNAEGLEVGKTRIKFKDVEIGEVTALRVSEDRQSVLATARLRKSAESYPAAACPAWAPCCPAPTSPSTSAPAAKCAKPLPAWRPRRRSKPMCRAAPFT